jgi:PAS domain S-box-containing protein
MAQALARARSEAALRASEQRWQSIFETSSIGISTIDKDLRYQSTNPAFRAMLGYSDEEFRHLTPLDITFEEEREIAQLRLAELQQGKVDHYAVVKRYRRKDGSVIWGHSSIARAMNYRPEMFIGAMIDITDSKLAEEKLRATEKELTRVTRLTAAGQMAASIAHEIKQPLAAIVAGASAGLRWLFRPKPDLAEVRAGLEAIVSDGNRASDVIEGIRAIFKNDSREKTPLDVSEVIREVLALMQFELHNHRILVSTELTSGLRPVFADRIQLQQVIANLIANAIEAMQFTEGRARTLRVRSATGVANDVLVVVEDCGPGIDPENLDRIYHPFFTTKPQGTGMGLSISRSIVEAHNGRLTVSPAADGGSVFQIALPAADLASCGESGD